MGSDLVLTQNDIERANSLNWSKRNRRIIVNGEWVPFSLSREPYLYPFLKDIYYARGFGGPKHIVIKKPRQVGATEYAINTALYAIDVMGINVVYTLPGQKELRAFAGARVNEIIRSSPKVSRLFSNIDNLDLKVGQKASLYFRGTNSKAGLEEIPAGYIIRDELDQMNKENANMILQALGASFHKWILDLSHPTDPGWGIDREYENSSQHQWVFRCPHCGEIQDVSWENNVDLKKRRFICRACDGDIDKTNFWDGWYEPKEPKNPVVGFHFNQLLSPTVELEEQIKKWEECIGIPYAVKIFYNTVLALAYAESSKKLSPDDVKKLMNGPSMVHSAKETAMGMDVGNGLHIWVQDEDNVLAVAQVNEWSDVFNYVEMYNPKCFVIDSGPETHAAREACEMLRERGIDTWLCMRSDGLKGKRIVDDDLMTIKVNKTEQFDEFYGKLSTMKLPHDLPEEAILSLTEPIRTTKEKPDGSKEGVWMKGRLSHYADAGSYAMEAAKQIESRDPFDLNIQIPSIQTQKSRWRKRFSG